MRGGNQLNPLLRTFRRLCLSSTSKEVVTEFSGRDIYTAQAQISKNRIGVSEIRLSSCLDFVRSSSASTEATPPDVQEAQRIPFRRKGGSSFARSRTNSVVAALVRTLESSQSNAQVAEILEQRSEELLPSSWPWLPLLDALQKGPKPHIAMEVFKWKKSKLGYESDPKEYAKMISFAGRINQPQVAAELFNEMEKRGLKKTAVAYNALIHSYGRNNEAHKALQLFEHMKTTIDCQPTLVTYNTLISMYSRMGATEEMQSIYKDCKQAGFSPDRHTYNSLIWGYMRAGHLNLMEEAFHELQAAECQADVITYNAQIIGYARATAVDKMEAAFASMQKAGMPINAMVGEILIEVYSRVKEFEKMEAALQIMVNTPGVSYGSRVHSLMIESYAEGGKLDEMEAAITRMFKGKRMFASPKTLHGVIMAYSRAAEYDRLAKTVEVIKAAGWILQPAIYNMLILEYGKGGEFDKMEQVYQSMVETSVKPTFDTFKYMVDAYEAVDNVAEADRVLDLMREAGCEPQSNSDRMWADDEIFGGRVRH